MERFIADIEAYTAACGITPQGLLRTVINAPWGQWQKWKDGKASPTLRIVDRIHAHMTANPPPSTPNQEQSHDQTPSGHTSDAA